MSWKSIRAKQKKSNSSIASINLLQRKCACGGTAGMAGACTECQEKNLTGPTPSLIQPKLKISQPNDKYEKEADRVADMVMRMPESNGQQQGNPEEEEEEEVVQPKLLSSQGSPIIQRQTEIEEEEEEVVQAKAEAGHTPLVASRVATGINSLRGHGKPLPQSTRNFFEPRFGRDFSHVQIHMGPQATKLTQGVNARAFTMGSAVVFGEGQYSQNSLDGKNLLAHELTHVVQQRAKDTTSNEGHISLKSLGKPFEKKRKSRRLRRRKRVLKRFLRKIERKRKVFKTKRNVMKAKEILDLRNTGDEDFKRISEKTMAQLVELSGESPTSQKLKTSDPSKVLDENQAEDTEEKAPSAVENEASDGESTTFGKEKCPPELLSEPFENKDLTAKAFMRVWNPISIKNNKEVCSIIVSCFSQETSKKSFYYIEPWGFADKKKARHSCLPWPAKPPFNGRKPQNYEGALHTHGGPDPDFINDKFSPPDRTICSQSGFPCFVATPSDCLLKNTGHGIQVLSDPKGRCDPRILNRKK